MSPKLMVLEFMEIQGELSIGLASESSRSTGEEDWAGEANAATLDRAPYEYTWEGPMHPALRRSAQPSEQQLIGLPLGPAGFQSVNMTRGGNAPGVPAAHRSPRGQFPKMELAERAIISWELKDRWHRSIWNPAAW